MCTSESSILSKDLSKNTPLLFIIVVDVYGHVYNVQQKHNVCPTIQWSCGINTNTEQQPAAYLAIPSEISCESTKGTST